MKYRSWGIRFIEKERESGYYEGALMGGDKSLHQQIFDLFQHVCKDKIKNNPIILDVGCGTGAFAKRLFNHDYNVECCDINYDEFMFKNLFNFYKIDLNSEEFIRFAKEKSDMM